MQAHKFIELLDDLKKTGQIEEQVAALLSEKIAESVKFEFNFGHYPEYHGESIKQITASFKLPFPLCFFILPDTGAILARQVLNSPLIPLLIFLKHPERGWMLIPPTDNICLDTENACIYPLSEDPSVLKAYENAALSEKDSLILSSMPSFMIRGVEIMNCSNVICRDNFPPAALNKKRKIAGKTPVFTYKTLHLKPSKAKNKQGASIGKNSPRLHLRRGHIRRLTPEKTTWVSSCVVGDEKKGIVMKNYRVTA